MRERIGRERLTYANVMSTISVFLVVSGGAAYAAGHLGKNAVGTKQLKKNSVTTAKIKKQAVTAAKVKNGTLTGNQINTSTLGTVPTADKANSLAAPEDWHAVGAPGEPSFLNSWKNTGVGLETAAFYKDHGGVVHLKGDVTGGTQDSIFQLPGGYRPASGMRLVFAAHCEPCGSAEVGYARVFGTGDPLHGSNVVAPPGAADVSLDGITFRAES